jgi:hypothetical protein
MGSVDVRNLGRLRRILTRLRKRNQKKFPLAKLLKMELIVVTAKLSDLKIAKQ